jgi:hypothetical protein
MKEKMPEGQHHAINRLIGEEKLHLIQLADLKKKLKA